MMRHLVWLAVLVVLAGCGSMGGARSTKPQPPAAEEKEATQPPATTQPSPGVSKKGGYYLDDGPMDGPQPDFDAIPDAVPRVEPLLARANRPYVALGETYTPMTEFQPYKASGIASWYGKRYHGQKTSTGEVYDMFGMTAAHPILPIPSYVRVTNPETGRSVVVRVNDRGPFKKDRLIDLSYAAAYKLGITGKGSGLVEVEAIDPRQPLPQPVLSMDRKLEKTAAAGGMFVQVGAFKQKDNADQLRERILRNGIAQNGAVESWYNDGIHRVRLGPYSSRDEAERAASQLKQSLGLTAIITTQ
jgi:rare lipoprotein A